MTTLRTAHAHSVLANKLTKDVEEIRAMEDPPKARGLVLTQIQSIGSHVMWHPVFKIPLTQTTIRRKGEPRKRISETKVFTPYKPDPVSKLEDGVQDTIRGCTSALCPQQWRLDWAEKIVLEAADVLQGFVGVCVSETRLEPSTDDYVQISKRRKADPHMTVAVAGTVTMPFFEGSADDPVDDGSDVQPGDLVAFAVLILKSDAGDFDDMDVRAVAGTRNRPGAAVEYMPRIRKFVESDVCYNYEDEVTYEDLFEFNCSAPFGVCVGLDREAGQITVLLRMDLYHSFYYDFAGNAV